MANLVYVRGSDGNLFSVDLDTIKSPGLAKLLQEKQEPLVDTQPQVSQEPRTISLRGKMSPLGAGRRNTGQDEEESSRVTLGEMLAPYRNKGQDEEESSKTTLGDLLNQVPQPSSRPLMSMPSEHVYGEVPVRNRPQPTMVMAPEHVYGEVPPENRPRPTMVMQPQHVYGRVNNTPDIDPNSPMQQPSQPVSQVQPQMRPDQQMARGGKVRRFADGGSADAGTQGPIDPEAEASRYAMGQDRPLPIPDVEVNVPVTPTAFDLARPDVKQVRLKEQSGGEGSPDAGVAIDPERRFSQAPVAGQVSAPEALTKTGQQSAVPEGATFRQEPKVDLKKPEKPDAGTKAGLRSGASAGSGESQEVIGYRKAKSEEEKALAVQNDLISKQQQANLDRMLDQHNQMMVTKQAHDQTIQQELDKYNGLLHEYSNQKINPEQFWANRSTGQNILAGIGLMLGALGASKDGINHSVGIIEDAIRRDIDAQKANLEKTGKIVGAKGNLINIMRSQYDSEFQQDAMASNVMRQYAVDQIEQLKTKTNSPIQQAQLESAKQVEIAKMKDEEKKLQIEAQRNAILAAKVAASGKPKEATKVEAGLEAAKNLRDSFINASSGVTPDIVGKVTQVIPGSDWDQYAQKRAAMKRTIVQALLSTGRAKTEKDSNLMAEDVLPGVGQNAVRGKEKFDDLVKMLELEHKKAQPLEE